MLSDLGGRGGVGGVGGGGGGGGINSFLKGDRILMFYADGTVPLLFWSKTNAYSLRDAYFLYLHFSMCLLCDVNKP